MKKSQAVSQSVSVKTEKMPKRNLFMFPLGTLGRDFLYSFFNGYLLTFILFTKTLSVTQFSCITFIIIASRVLDAFNDPLMGGIVENTRSKWGKYKPWQLLGATLTAIVIIALFNVNLDGWAFIAFLAVGYLLFSITFTMNDISYWGMMPALTSNPAERNKLISYTQVVCTIGAGLAGGIVPALTAGGLGTIIFGNAVSAYRVLSVIVSVMMVGFQLFTIFGVKEPPQNFVVTQKPRMKIKDMFKVLVKNDQLLWASLTMLLFNVGPNIYMLGLGILYNYLEFGYNGLLWTVFGIGCSIVALSGTAFYPIFSKKWGRDKVLMFSGISSIISFVIIMLSGLVLPTINLFSIPFLNITISLKYIAMFIGYTLGGTSTILYLISVINITNSIEYNEYKTGEKNESLIFSIRPFTSKLGSALIQGLISLVYIIAGVITTTNAISNAENDALRGTITPEQKTEQINALIATVPEKNKIILLVCMCVIPILIILAGLIIYKKKFKLNEEQMDFMLKEIEKRKQEDEGAVEENKPVEKAKTTKPKKEKQEKSPAKKSTKGKNQDK